LFKWPNVYDIWNTYLTKFLKRYGGTKLERTRDLFEQCLEQCPGKYAKSMTYFIRLFYNFIKISYFSLLGIQINFCLFVALYLLYAKLEEEYGLARHAMSVYERATNAVLLEERFDVIFSH